MQISSVHELLVTFDECMMAVVLGNCSCQQPDSFVRQTEGAV